MQSSGPQQPENGLSERTATIIGWVLLVLLAGGVVALGLTIYPNELRSKNSPNFIDNIFDSRLVIFIVRVVILAAAVYAVASVVGLILNRQWIERIGPVQVAQSVAEYERQNIALSYELADAAETIEALQERLDESDTALEQAESDIQTLRQYLDTMDDEDQVPE
jgi:hypothetical protein